MTAEQKNRLVLDIKESLVSDMLVRAATTFLENIAEISCLGADQPGTGENRRVFFLTDSLKEQPHSDSALFLLWDEARVLLQKFDAPFRPGEIFDRIIKEMTLAPAQDQKKWPSEIEIGQCLFVPASGILQDTSGQVLVVLTEKERDILCFLYENRARSVGRQELLDFVWNYAGGVETHTLETHIYRIRQKIESDPARPSCLITEETGYRLRL